MKLNVHLNDFASFDQVLFNSKDMKLPEKDRWKKFYHDEKEAIYIPLPDMPTTIGEYQFCHYIYWMTIWANELAYKPWIYFSFMGKVTKPRIPCSCFACGYVTRSKLEHTDYCPIKLYRCNGDEKCVKNKKGAYKKWAEIFIFAGDKHYIDDLSASDLKELNVFSYATAHMEWEEKTEDNCRLREYKADENIAMDGMKS